MKTVEVLAKYLDAWPPMIDRIFQHSDDNFYLILCKQHPFATKVITPTINPNLSGLSECEDAGVEVTVKQWKEQKEKDKAKRLDTLTGSSMHTPAPAAVSAPIKKALDPMVSAYVAQAKIDTLKHHITTAGVPEDKDIEIITKRINEAFDKLKF